jgi:hypothetical protein
LGALLLAAPTQAQNSVPSALIQEKLIKNALLTLNDANLTDNYTVLHALLAKPFRLQFTPERLREGFKPFRDKETDFSIIAAKPLIVTAEAAIDKRGVLLLRGYFDAAPNRISYEIEFLTSEGVWKPLKLTVNVKPISQK